MPSCPSNVRTYFAATMKERHRMRMGVARVLLTLTLAGLIAFPPGAAWAWKPTTHVYLAEIAVQEALSTGHVTIPILGTQEVRTYAVPSEVLQALRLARAQYHAGVLGPDAFPDIATGQMSIHPKEEESGVPGGSNTWLANVWDNFNGSPQERAFRLGFLTHAAGDMYGHTFINYFTGAPFTLDPPTNAIKHVVLEGYIDKRLPGNALLGSFWDSSIDGLEAKIYSTMVDARPGSRLDGILRPGSPGGKYSVPRIFSTLRTGLDLDIAAYYQHKADLQKKIKDCGWLDFSCSNTGLAAQLSAYVVANGPRVTYEERWRNNIDDGLRAWPATSHAVAKALFFNPQRKADTTQADAILTEYAQVHILSMAGAPNFVGLTMNAVSQIIEAITPDFLLVPIRALKEHLLNTMLKAAIGMDKQELQDYLTRPDRYFDQVMVTGSGQHVTLADFNRDYLKISDHGYTNPSEAFDWRQVPAAYNTVMLSKLILIAPPSAIDRLIADLGGSARLSEPNVMLGFIRTLDGSRQWRSGFVLARDCKVYDKIFKPLPGDGGCQG
jgi:hypothetical protein